MKKTIKLLSCILCFTTATVAQQNDETTNTLEQLEQQVESHEMVIKQLKQFKVSGYVQTQFQYGEKNASLKVGRPTPIPKKVSAGLVSDEDVLSLLTKKELLRGYFS